jgi:hypothetical protein
LEVCLSIERAERFAKAGTLTEHVAKKIIAEIVERTSGEKLHDHTARAWFDEWCAGKADTKSAATTERYKQVTREFLDSLGNRATLSLGACHPEGYSRLPERGACGGEESEDGKPERQDRKRGF